MARSKRGGPRRNSGGSNPKRKPVAPEDETFVELDPDAEELDEDLDEDDDLEDEPEDEDADLEDDEDDDELDEDDDLDEDDGDEDDGDETVVSKGSRHAGGPRTGSTRKSTRAKSSRTKSSGASKPSRGRKPADRRRHKDDEDDEDDGGALGAALDGKSRKVSRRDRIAAMQQREERERRARSARLVTLCIVLALAVLAYPVYMFVDNALIAATPRNEIGVPASAASCLEDEKHLASGNQEHVDDGTIVQYERLPPDSGPHYQNWTEFGETFYSVNDRPAIENLVHNLEHGYTILWYDSDTVTADEVKWLQALAKTFNGSDPVTNKFKAAPWSPQYDGGEFPEGTKFMLVRWLADPDNPTDLTQQFGVRRACAQLSGEVVDQFMEQYPQPSSPEPLGG